MHNLLSWMGGHKIWTTVIVVVAVMAFGSFGEEDPQQAAGASKSTETVDPTPAETSADPTEEKSSTEAESKAPGSAAPSPSHATRPKAKPKPEPKPKRYAVLEVVDGDTVKVAYGGGESVRVIGIDTPETVSPSTPDECWGQAASAAAHRLLTGKKVSLVFDASQGRRDRYDRLLAYVQVPGVGDYGLAMIRRGHAAEYTYAAPYKRQALYRSAESRAKAVNLGLWNKCGGPDVPLHKPKHQMKRKGFVQPAAPAGNCAPGYNPCVPPYPPDVDCADVNGPITVTGPDPHGLDADGDGVACES